MMNLESVITDAINDSTDTHLEGVEAFIIGDPYMRESSERIIVAFAGSEADENIITFDSDGFREKYEIIFQQTGDLNYVEAKQRLMGELIPVILGILHGDDLGDVSDVLRVDSLDPFYDENNVLASFHMIISVPASFEFVGPEREVDEVIIRGELDD